MFKWVVVALAVILLGIWLWLNYTGPCHEAYIDIDEQVPIIQILPDEDEYE